MTSIPLSGKCSKTENLSEESPPALEHLFWFIKGSDEGLAIAQVNAPVLREKLIHSLTQRCRAEGVPVLSLSLNPESNLFYQIKEAYEKTSPQPRTIFVENFERLTEKKTDKEVRNYVSMINFGRETLTAVKAVVVFWLPQYWHTNLIKYAPDLYDWRGIVLEFEAGVPDVKRALADIVQTRYPAETRRKMIQTLHGQYRQAIERQEHPAYLLKAYLLPLARLYYEDQEFSSARDLYEKALKLSEELRDKTRISITLHQLGIIDYMQGDYSAAVEKYNRSLEIEQEWGDKAGNAITLGQ